MKQKIKWIGLTGGIASGKSTVSRLFESRGIPVIDADKIAKDVVRLGSPGLQKITQAFGPDILSAGGDLDRKKMGALVFSKPEHLATLEAIIHPLVQSEVQQLRQKFESQGHKLIVYDVPLLFEKNMQAQFEGVVLVWCDLEKQKQRLKERDKLNDSEVQARLSAQVPTSEKKKSANWLIENNSTKEVLEQNFEAVLRKLQS